MTDYMVSVNEARDLLDGYETLKSSPECSGACARAAAPELARTVVALHERVAAVEAERDRMREREEHFARVLSVTDGGQYRADWDSAIRRVVAERDALRKRVADAEYDINREVEARNAAGAELDAVLAHAEELTQALRETQRERDAMKAIVEGRTTPPTVEEAEAHINAGRSFRVVSVNGGAYSAESVLAVDLAVSDFPGSRWWALDSHGRPCAWPEVPRG